MDKLESLKERLARKIRQAAQGVKKQQIQSPKAPNSPQRMDIETLQQPQNYQIKSVSIAVDKEQVDLQEQLLDLQNYPHAIKKRQLRKKDIYFDLDDEEDQAENQIAQNSEEIQIQQSEIQFLPFGAEKSSKKKQEIEEISAEKKQLLEKKKIAEAWLKPKIQPFTIQKIAQNTNQQEIQKQIQTMLKQPQSLPAHNTEEQQETEKYKQLMLNTIKNKTKKKHKRPMDKPTPFEQLSPPYQQIKLFASYLPRYEERRSKQLFGNSVDLGVRTLHEVVLQCYLEGIISKELMLSIQKIGVDNELNFIKKFAENKLEGYQFNKVKFTPLDYRRLCTILICHNKQKYTMGERIYCVFKEITDFYQVIYEMDENEYNQLCNSIVITYKLTWWKQILKKQQQLFDSQNHNLDTSTIYQPQPSPLFGANIDDPENDFFKAKKKLYPEKVNEAKIKKSGTSSVQNSDFSMNDKKLGSEKNEQFESIREASQEGYESSSNSKKYNSSIRDNPEIDDNDEQGSQFSSLKRHRKRNLNRKNSYSMMSESNMNRELSSVNSSRFDQFNDNSGLSISDSLVDDNSQVQSSVLDSFSLSSIPKKSRKKQKKGKKNKSHSKKKKNRKDSISLSDNDDHDVFVQSSDQEMQSKKRKKKR